MKVCCISDLHGKLPEIPKCDLLLIAGDICGHSRYCDQPGDKTDLQFQRDWLKAVFASWADSLPVDEIHATWGNHDFIGQHDPSVIQGKSRCQFWLDETVNISIKEDGGNRDWKIYFTPWSLWFYDWAFNAPKVDGESWLATKFKAIPAGTDIIVSHGPPKFHGDRTCEGVLTGSVALLERTQTINPRLVVTGHIHEAYGSSDTSNGTQVVNASVLNRDYRMTNKPVIIELD